MPGFMGLGNEERKNAHDQEKERREAKPKRGITELERRSQAKIEEILSSRPGEGEIAGEAPPARPESEKPCSGFTVGDVMAPRVAVVNMDDTILTVKGIFNHVRFHHLPVVDENKKLVGIISDRDFLRAVSPFMGTVNEQTRDIEIMKRKASLIMTRRPLCVSPDEDLCAAVAIMHERRVSCLLVTNKAGELLGIVTWKDIVRAYCPEGFTGPREATERFTV